MKKVFLCLALMVGIVANAQVVVDTVARYDSVSVHAVQVDSSSNAVTRCFRHDTTSYIPDGPWSVYCLPEPFFRDTIRVSGFDTATITSVEQLSTFWLNLEHSYPGDLNVTLTSPDGFTVRIMIDNGTQYGENTHLGEPRGLCDHQLFDSTGCDPAYEPAGLGYTYCFRSAGPTRTFSSARVPLGNSCYTCDSSSYALGTGYYAPFESFSAFVGSPIDGNWVLTVTDKLAPDNGWIFGWGIDFKYRNAPLDTTYLDFNTVTKDNTGLTDSIVMEFDVQNFQTDDKLFIGVKGMRRALTEVVPTASNHFRINLGTELSPLALYAVSRGNPAHDILLHDFLVMAYTGSQQVESIDMVQYDNLIVYPNPTTSTIHISGEIGQVAIYDHTGHLVMVSQSPDIDLSSLSKGVYFVKSKGGIAKVIKL